jgi:hypothetical protein
MSGDELFILLISFPLAAWALYAWYAPALSVERLGAPSPGLSLLMGLPWACAVLLFIVLKTVSSHDVRDSPTYLLFYVMLGGAWIGTIARFLPLAGLSPRDDVVERGNGAAATALAGALLALTLCFAGGNIGDGPGWWVVVFAAGLATGTLAVLWLLFDWLTYASDAITIDRDAASGARLAGLLVGAGLVLGRAVAGDWVSLGATVADFVAAGWPAPALFIAAIWIERRTAPSPERPRPPFLSFGALPAALYVAAAAAHVVGLGPAW